MIPSKFYEWLVKQQANYDKLIVEDATPLNWVFHIPDRYIPEWFQVRELVRRTVEGMAYKPSKKPPAPSISAAFDRFALVYPNMDEHWNEVRTDNCLGKPTDC